MYENDDFNWGNEDEEKSNKEQVEQVSEEPKEEQVVEQSKPEQVFYTETIAKKKKKGWVGALAGLLAGILITSGAFAGYSAWKSFYYKPNTQGQTNGQADKSNSFNYNQLSPSDRVQKPVVDIASEVGPAVVGITNKMQTQSFFGPIDQEGSGSGIIISQDGYIVTNNHVIENATEVTVYLSNSKKYPAKLIGTDPKTDLAILKIEEKGLPVAVLGDSTKLQVGELAVAIGNPLGLELAGSVTVGIISAVNRSITVENSVMKLIQTDAAINPGNSGGALVNGYGEVIGINNMKLSGTNVEGIGFAIPINVAKSVIDELINSGYVKGRPLIGISVTEITKDIAFKNDLPMGLYVAEIAQMGAADRAGIKKGDIIVKANGQKILTLQELNDIKDKLKVGDIIKMDIIRDGNTISVDVKLQEDKSAMPVPTDQPTGQ